MHRLFIAVYVTISGVFLGCANQATYPGLNEQEVSFMAFFEHCQALMNAYDPSVADCYAEDAVYTTGAIAKDGSVEHTVITGRDIKAVIHSLIALNRAAGIEETFEKVTITVNEYGNRATIKAHRYDNFTCYLDTTHTFTIEKQPDGRLLFVGGSSESPISSHCLNPRPLPVTEALTFTADLYRQQTIFPQSVSDHLYITGIAATDKRLTVYKRMPEVQFTENSVITLQEVLQQYLNNSTCADERWQQLLAQGAMLMWRIDDSIGQSIAVMVDNSQCVRHE